jgi:hypothetical protein
MTHLTTYLEERRKLAEAADVGPLFTSGESFPGPGGRLYEVSTEGGMGIWVAHCQSSSAAHLIADAGTHYLKLIKMLEVATEALSKYRHIPAPSYQTEGLSTRDLRLFADEALANLEEMSK